MLKPWQKKREEDEFEEWEYKEEGAKKDYRELKKIIAAVVLFCVVYSLEHTETVVGQVVDYGVNRMVTEHTDFSALNDRMQSYLPEEWRGKVLENVQNVVARPANPLLYLNAPSDAEIVSCFGKKIDEKTKKEFLQTGVEYKNDFGDFVKAVSLGKVKKIAIDDKLGWFVVIEHGQNVESIYGYLGDVLVKEGDRISRGQNIARSGERPSDKEALLYFELREKNVAINPEDRIKGNFTAQGGA